MNGERQIWSNRMSGGSRSEVGRTEESWLDPTDWPYGECEACMLSCPGNPARYANWQYIRGHALCSFVKRLPIPAFSEQLPQYRHTLVLPQPTRQD